MYWCVLLTDEDDIPTMGVLQAGLFNEQDHIDEVITLTVQLLSMAVDDPGLPGELNNVSNKRAFVFIVYADALAIHYGVMMDGQHPMKMAIFAYLDIKPLPLHENELHQI